MLLEKLLNLTKRSEFYDAVGFFIMLKLDGMARGVETRKSAPRVGQVSSGRPVHGSKFWHCSQPFAQGWWQPRVLGHGRLEIPMLYSISAMHYCKFCLWCPFGAWIIEKSMCCVYLGWVLLDIPLIAWGMDYWTLASLCLFLALHIWNPVFACRGRAGKLGTHAFVCECEGNINCLRQFKHELRTLQITVSITALDCWAPHDLLFILHMVHWESNLPFWVWIWELMCLSLCWLCTIGKPFVGFV